MNKIIEVDHLFIDYDNNPETLGAINDVSFDINENEFVCIVGPSGCGKSTLLKAIAGFIKPVTGHILMDGTPVEGPDKSRGVVFQEPNLFPWYTVKENASIGPKIAGKSKQEIEEISMKFLGQVELLDYVDSKVFELSGGQKQRVAIARTLANLPKVILMDEPFGALDSFTRSKMQVMLRSLWNKNQSTIFFVTHDIEEALLLGTKIFVMKRGMQSIVKSYELDYTYALLKDPLKDVTSNLHFSELKKEITSLQ